jgi:hypothetical protein
LFPYRRNDQRKKKRIFRRFRRFNVETPVDANDEGPYKVPRSPLSLPCKIGMERAMARHQKLDKIPELLDALVTTPEIATAARRVGLHRSTVFNYLVRSRLGDPELQEIEWYGVVAPFHVHATQNARALTAQAIQASAMDRALNGCYVDVFYQGQRQYERVKKAEYADMSDEDIAAFGIKDAYEMRPVRQWLKPSDALTLKMLESWDKRYRPHQEIDVNYGGVLRIERPGEATTKQIAAKPIFDDTNEAEQRGGVLALARPAKSSEEMDEWAQQGDFAPRAVKFVGADGKETTLSANERSLPAPSTPTPNHARPLDAAGTGRGNVPSGGFKVR